MAFPTYIAKGTFTTSTSNPSADPPLPAGIQNGDLIIAVISYPVTNTPTSSDPAWTLLAQTSTGTSGNAGCIGVAVFYAIYAGSALGGFSTSSSFPLKTYQTYAFRQARIPSVSATDVQATAATSWTLPGITTADNDSFVFFAIGNDRDANSTANVSGYTNSNLANITEIHDQTTSTGLGGGIATVYAEEATPSSIGTTSCTSASSNTAAFITFAIAPAIITADGGTYSYTGTAATLTYTPVGAFTLTADPGTYSYTGTAANLSAVRIITAGPGVYSYTGTAASLERNLTITADAGSYSYSGTAANLTYKYPESASDNTLGTVSGTAYVAISDVLKVSTTSSASLTFSGELTFQPQTLTNGVYDVQIIWRYRTVGGSFVDVGSGIGSSSTAEVESGTLIIVGEISAATTQGSLSANTNYEVQLYARRTVSSPTNTIEFSGTAQVDATGGVYTLTADAGSYSYAGTAAALIAARKVIANSGSYTYTGTAANTVRGRKVIADPGSYAYTGTAANTLFKRKVIADSGAYSYTGSAASTLYNRAVSADAGTYTYTGTAASLVYGKIYIITADPGTYSYAGTDASLKRQLSLTADSGSYSYTGTAASTLFNRKVAADPNSYSYTGTAANTVYNRKVIADPGAYSYTGTAANLYAVRIITADPGVYSYTGTAASLERNLTITADAGSYNYSGTVAGLSYKYPTTNSDSTLGTVSGTAYVAISDVLNVSTTASASLTFSGELTFQPQTLTDGVYYVEIIWRYRTVGGSFVDVGTGITAPIAAEVESGSLTITGEVSAATTQGSLSANTNYQVQLYARRTLASPTNTIEFFGTAQVDATGNAYSIAADAGSYSYSGTTAGLIAARKAIADSGSYTYSGTAANLVFGRAVAADPGSYTYSGTAADFLVNRKIAADAGSYSYTGTAATTLFNRKVAADAGTYSYTGTAANLVYGQAYTLTADSGVYAYSGTSATLTYTSGLFNILLGSSTVSSVKLGTTTVTKVYLGTTKVFG